MEKFIRPRQIIEWFKQNENNTKEINKLSLLMPLSRASDYDIRNHKSFLSFECKEILIYLVTIYNYITLNDETFDPEEKITLHQEFSDGTSIYMIRGSQYRVATEWFNQFIYEKKSFKEEIKDFNSNDIKLDYTPNNSLTIKDNNTIADIEKNSKAKEEEMKALKENFENQIKEMEREFALKLSQAKLDMAEKMSGLVQQSCSLENDIANMERSIYRYLSYKGNTFEIKKIASGANANSDDKLVIWQKVRYLDEELPKLSTIDSIADNINYEKFESFENLLKDYPILRDYFLPSLKCCVAFQLSRNGISYTHNLVELCEVTKGSKGKKVSAWNSFVTSSFQIANYNKLGLFLRNGENIYVAWLDKEKINIQSDSLFITNSSDDNEFDVKYEEYSNIENTKDEYKGEQALSNLKTLKRNCEKKIELDNKFSSRIYIVDILQGIIDNQNDIFTLPAGQNVLEALSNRSFKDIIFNNADNYIEDLKWKDFKDISKEFVLKDEEIKIGQDVYVISYFEGKDRGRYGSSQNRTSFSSIGKGFKKINMIDFIDKYTFVKDIDKKDLINFDYFAGPDTTHPIATHYTNCYYYSVNNEMYDRSGELTYTVNGVRKSAKMYEVTINPETKKENKWEFKEKQEKYSYFIIDDFENATDFKLEFSYSYLTQKRKIEEPFESRIEMEKQNKYIREKGRYEDVEVSVEKNEVYEHIHKWYKTELELGFKEDKLRRKREYWFYVSAGSYSSANVHIYSDEFIPLKKITKEHIEYMINHKFILPCDKTFAESLNSFIAINNMLKEKENNKKQKGN